MRLIALISDVAMTKLIYVLLLILELTTPKGDGHDAPSGQQPQPGRGNQPIFAPAPGSPFAVGTRPGDVAVGDVNRDGYLDIITTNGGSNNVSILLGDGKGGFKAAPESPVAVGIGVHLVALGDLNRDGNPDLALTNHDSISVTVFLGNGRAGFSAAPRSPFAVRTGSKAHNHGLVLRDVNGDSNLDIVTGDQDDNSVSVLLGDGTAGFIPAPGSPFAVGKGPYPIELGDIDGDGKLDIVTPNTGSNDITILLGNGKGQFTAAPRSPFPVVKRPYYIALGDLNRDRKLDVVASHDDTNLLTVSLGDGTGQFKPAPGSPVDLGSRAWAVVIDDVNQDERLDIVAATNTTITVLLGDGRSGFTSAAGSPVAIGRGAWKVVLGDVNRDGKQDVVANNLEGNAVAVLLAR